MRRSAVIENKLDRANLRRQAQRIESYKSLITRPRFSLKNFMLSEKSNSYAEVPKAALFQPHSNEIEDEHPGKFISIHSPASSIPSSSDSSEGFQLNLCSSLKYSSKNEQELTSVMTRSATRKYASVGSIHNRVNMEKELKVKKRWPTHITYPTPEKPNDLKQLRDVVTKSFNEVLMFCKTAVVPDEKESQPEPAEDWCTYQETTESFIDLLPYITQEPAVSDGNQITFHLDNDYINHPSIPSVNIIDIEEEDHEGTLVIHDSQDEEYETITLHSGGTYIVDDNYFGTSNYGFNPNCVQILHANNLSGDATRAVANDHTYAAKPIQTFVAKDLNTPQEVLPVQLSKDECAFSFEKSLNDLLLNTAILKCLICSETPHEMICQLGGESRVGTQE